MSVHVSPGVVGAVHAAVELHEDPLGAGRPRAGGDARTARPPPPAARPRAGSARRGPRCRCARCAPPSSVSHTPAAEMPMASRSGSPGQVSIECRHSPPAPGCQRGRDGMLPQRLVELEAGAAVAALEQRAGVAAGVHRALALAGDDHPDPLERRVAALGQRDAAGLLPLAGGVVGVPELRPVERRGDRGVHPPGPGVPQRVLDRLAGEQPRRDLERRARLPLEHDQALLRPHQQLGHQRHPPESAGSTSIRVAGVDARVLRAELPVHEHVDVPPQHAALVEDPALRGRVRGLDRRQQLTDRAALERVLGAVAGEALSGPRRRTTGMA